LLAAAKPATHGEARFTRANTKRPREAVLVLVIVAVMLDIVATDVAALIVGTP